jgi:hypothetical protein
LSFRSAARPHSAEGGRHALAFFLLTTLLANLMGFITLAAIVILVR